MRGLRTVDACGMCGLWKAGRLWAEIGVKAGEGTCGGNGWYCVSVCVGGAGDGCWWPPLEVM